MNVLVTLRINLAWSFVVPTAWLTGFAIYLGLGQAGLLCPDMPEEFGGAGTSPEVCLAMIEELSLLGMGGIASGYGKDRLVATLLALLLGAFGVHRFYLGNIAVGVVYLLFFWTGIPGLIAWLEAIYFLTRSNEDWARTYGGPVQQPNGCAIGCLWALALWPLVAIVGLAIMLVLGLQIAWISSL